jgi:hypothetical protein
MTENQNDMYESGRPFRGSPQAKYADSHEKNMAEPTPMAEIEVSQTIRYTSTYSILFYVSK